MNPPPAKILTDPLGLAGYALFLLFGLLTLIVRKRQKKPGWLIPAGVTLAAVCIVGCLGLAYLRESRHVPPPPAPTQSMHIDSVEQTVTNGNAITGVQGTVTVQSAADRSAKSTQTPTSIDKREGVPQK